MMKERELSRLARRRRRIVEMVEDAIFAGAVVGIYIVTCLCLKWAGVK